MERIASADVDEDLFGSGKDGFQDPVPGANAGTLVDAAWLNGVQEAIVRPIELSGQTPGSATNQLWQAILRQWQGAISPSTLTASVNDYAPTNGATAGIWWLTADAVRSITGIAAPASTDEFARHLLVNGDTGTHDLILRHQDASSSAANRLTCPGGQDYRLVAGESVSIYYDVGILSWRVLGLATNKNWVFTGTLFTTPSHIVNGDLMVSGDVNYATPPTRTVLVKLPNRDENASGSASGWTRPLAGTVVKMTCGSNSDELLVDLDLPDGATLTNVRAGVEHGGSAPTPMSFGVYKTTVDKTLSGGITSSSTLLGSLDNATVGAGADILDSGAISETVDNANCHYAVWVAASNTAASSADTLHWIEATFTDPGPRNF
jgi:hypothetical protein